MAMLLAACSLAFAPAVPQRGVSLAPRLSAPTMLGPELSVVDSVVDTVIAAEAEAVSIFAEGGEGVLRVRTIKRCVGALDKPLVQRKV